MMLKAAPDRRNCSVLVLTAVFFIFLLSGCGGSYPGSPYTPEEGTESDADYSIAWEDVLASDSNYPDNVYLTGNIEFHPGKVGASRLAATPSHYDDEGYPLDSTKDGACGPPEGSTVTYSNSKADMSVLGSGGWAVWRFDPEWVIVDGTGDDFITFSNHNVLSGDPDGSWNELGHVCIAEEYDPDNPDETVWYKNGNEACIVNTTPGEANSGYDWSAVSGVHGNNHCWANFREDVAAEALDPATESYEPVTDGSGNQVYVSKYFGADDDYLGGDRFDLSGFVSVDDGSAWPAGGKMRYLKLSDDPSILDGQDYAPDWMTGTRLMAAMGINVEAAE